MDDATFTPRGGRLLFAIATVLAIGSFAFSANASAANQKLRVAYTAAPSNVPVIIAQEQGFYKKNKLDVTLTPQQNATQALATLGKQFDISNETVENLLSLQAKGFGPKVVVGNDIQTKKYQSTFIYGRQGAKSWKALKGKTIGTVAVGAGAYYAALLIKLKQVGLKPTDVKFVQVPFPNMLDQLKAGRIDVAASVEPFSGQMKSAGFASLGNPIVSITSPAISNMWIGNAKAVKKNTAKYRAFNKSITQAVKWMKTHDSAWKASIVKNFKLPPAIAAKSNLLPTLQPKVNPKWITAWIRPFESIGLLKKGKVKPSQSAGLIMKP